MVVFKAQVDCLLGNLHQVGPGNRQSAKKRVWAIAEDQRMAKERGAQWLRRVEGVHTLQKGFFKSLSEYHSSTIFCNYFHKHIHIIVNIEY